MSNDRLGAMDRCALHGLKIAMAALDKDDSFQDLMEEYLIETNERAATLVELEDEASLDEFYKMLDKYQDKVMRRMAQALIDIFRPPPRPLPAHQAADYVPRPSHPVAAAYQAWLEDTSMQT